MLLGFGVKNYFSFKEGVEVSLKKRAKDSSELKAIDILCVKGANGSGKTNLLKIISFMHHFCCDSFKLKPEDIIGVESFFEKDEPSEFYIDFTIDETQYRYELSITDTNVLRETLFRKKQRFVKIIERIDDEITLRINEFEDIDIIKLRSNASLISTAHQYEVESINPIYYFFSSIISNVTMYGRYSEKWELSSVAELYYKDKSIFTFMKELIKKCDLGIYDIKIKKRKDETNSDIFYPEFIHKTNNSHKKLLYRNQSSGTRALFTQLWIYEAILDEGGVLVLDEFDINLHPHILPLLLELFKNKKINKHNSQLIFTTHNTQIIDSLGKYKVFLVNKEDNESYGYRLDEIPGEMIRNDRPISPLYDSGKIGGVPEL
ncbi:ATP-binding protein [uncultured Desulfobacter sp.]|uniref:AAA family ATPase n=1 Tax=uncultured Desulfobacter sp. TaxID=240139 RepID=UPI002AA80ADD|nr:ATP-binding protein [uncultured Desulfobacter sp.]